MASSGLTVGMLYRQLRDQFRQAGVSTPDIDAKFLVCAVLNLSVSELFLREDLPVSQDLEDCARAFSEKRLAGVPVGRILAEREFFGRSFELVPSTLEPRPDTETLVDLVLSRCERGKPAFFCDVGTGSGAIAVTLLAELPFSRAMGLDVSFEALACAQRNAEAHGVSDRFLPVCANYCETLQTQPSNSFDVTIDWIVSNPPYIRTADLQKLSREVIENDPLLALDGGEDGLDAYKKIIYQAKNLLSPGGNIALEIGFDQADSVRKLLLFHLFKDIEIVQDLSGNDRVLVARK